MNYTHKNKKYQFSRYPINSNKSLRPWNAADELVLCSIEEENIPTKSIVILNDRFGFLSTILYEKDSIFIVEYRSQEKAIRQNLITNAIRFEEKNINTLFSNSNDIHLLLLKIPKSLNLFELYLSKFSEKLTQEATVICSFMTRNFSPKMIEIASHYFEDVTQSKAQKKARLLILKKKRKTKPRDLINTITFKNKKIDQYYGVFSAKNIDYATQFLLANLKLKEQENIILDFASGNGIIALFIREQNKNAEIHLVDDSFLAIESSKLNLMDDNTFHHQNNTLEEFQNNFFDLIVINPPFHFEYETNIDVSLHLFKEAKRCLSKGGRFLVVGNLHLNYKTHLIKLFSTVNSLSKNDKFEIYECKK